MVRHLTLREALACDRLAEFVRQAEAGGVEFPGSDFERALALLITRRLTAPRPAKHAATCAVQGNFWSAPINSLLAVGSFSLHVRLTR